MYALFFAGVIYPSPESEANQIEKKEQNCGKTRAEPQWQALSLNRGIANS
jgi:hypothetical protein